MSHKALYRHLKAPLKKAENALLRCAREPGREKNIHNLRTSVKKLKACLKAAQTLDDDFKYNKTFAPWQKIFKIAAESRDMLVAKKLMQAESTEKHTGHTIPGFEKLAEKVLSHEKDTLHALKRAAAKHHAEKHLKKYYAGLVNKALDITGLKPDKRVMKMHILRKVLKEMYYNLPVWCVYKDLCLPETDMKPWLKTTTDLLGKWHDCKMTLEKISKGEIQPDGSAEKPEEFVQRIMHRKHILEVRIGRICDDKPTLAKMLPEI